MSRTVYTSIIRDRSVLTEDFVPEELLHRQSQLEEVKEEVEHVLEHGSERYIQMYGPSGTGKTTLAKYLKEQFHHHKPDLFPAYVNCWTRYSRFKVLYSIIEQSDDYRLLHSHLTSTDDLIAKLQSIRGDQPAFIVLDEADLLKDTQTLYDLTGENTALLIITNQRNPFSDLDPRTRSRLTGKKTIKFPRYRHRELIDILEKRVRAGLQRNVITDDQLDTVAEEGKGDARKSIRILKLAAEQAEQDGADRIADQHIQAGVDESDSAHRRKRISQLNEDQKVIVKILKEHPQGIRPKDLYATYQERATNPVSNRTLRRHISKLERYNLVETKGQTKGRRVALKQ